MEVRHVLLVNDFRLDPTGKFYAAGGFNQITSESYPSYIGNNLLAIILDAEPGEGFEPVPVRLVIRRVGADAPLIETVFDSSNLEADQDRNVPSSLHVVVNLAQVLLPEPGTYYFDVSLEHGGIHSVKLNVQLREEEKTPQ